MTAASLPADARALQAFGPGKIILLGEHAVVYGHPALAAPLSKGVRVVGVPAAKCLIEAAEPALKPEQKEALERAFAKVAKAVGAPGVSVSLSSDLPVSMGLGSSGAVAVACARLLLQAKGKPFTPEKLESLALLMEREFHGTPSGVDHTTSARGTMLLYRKRGPIRAVKARRPVKVLVALVGERTATKVTVAQLRERQARWPKTYRRLFDEVGRLAELGAKAAAAGDLAQLGDLMNINHGLLCALGLSSERLDAMVHQLRARGALGAKITGAGGDGGAVIALFQEPEPTVAHLLNEGVSCFSSLLAGPETL